MFAHQKGMRALLLEENIFHIVYLNSVCNSVCGSMPKIRFKYPILIIHVFIKQNKIFGIYKELYGKPRDWVARAVFLIQIFLIFGGRCNRFF